jgi:5-methylcytosine-specific restriction endonuclease McrA
MPLKNRKSRIAYLAKWSIKNRDKIRGYNRRWNKSNPEKARIRKRRWGQNNLEKVSAKNHNYRENNLEKMRKREQQYKRDNPRVACQHVINRRARVIGAEGSHTLQEWNQLKIKHQYKCMLQISPRCLITLTDKTATRDHIVPISKGGLNSIGNIVPVCRSCNSSKGVKIEFNPTGSYRAA